LMLRTSIPDPPPRTVYAPSPDPTPERRGTLSGLHCRPRAARVRCGFARETIARAHPFNTAMSDPTSRPVPLEQTRQRIVEQLCEHYAAENLTDELLEQRLGQAYAATTLPELHALVADLPTEPIGGPSQSVAIARPETVSERQVVLAVMGGAERKGVWTP